MTTLQHSDTPHPLSPISYLNYSSSSNPRFSFYYFLTIAHFLFPVITPRQMSCETFCKPVNRRDNTGSCHVAFLFCGLPDAWPFRHRPSYCPHIHSFYSLFLTHPPTPCWLTYTGIEEVLGLATGFPHRPFVRESWQSCYLTASLSSQTHYSCTLYTNCHTVNAAHKISLIMLLCSISSQYFQYTHSLTSDAVGLTGTHTVSGLSLLLIFHWQLYWWVRLCATHEFIESFFLLLACLRYCTTVQIYFPWLCLFP